MIEPGLYEPPLREGIRFRKAFSFSDSNGLLDFTGCTFRSQVRLLANSPDPAIIDVSSTPSADGSIAIVGLGVIEVFYAKEAMTRLKGIKKFSWDVVVTWPNGIDNDCLLRSEKTLIGQTVTEPT